MDGIIASLGCKGQRESEVRSFTALLIAVTLIHVAAFVVVILIRLWPTGRFPPRART
jgi:hypothetical protein